MVVAGSVFQHSACGQVSMPLGEHWEVGGGGGFLVPHRAVIQSLIDGHASQIQLNWSRQGQGLWSCSRSEPRWGIGLRWGASGASAAVGRQASVLAMSELRMSNTLGFRFGAGIGWTENRWSPDTPEGRQHVVIGSPINAAIEIGLHRRPRPALQGVWHSRIGVHLTFAHQSNASFTQPNLGTNVACLGLSTLVWSRAHQQPKHKADVLIPAVLSPPRLGWTLSAAMGRRQPAPLDQRETTFEWGLDRNWGRGLRLGGVTGMRGFARPAHLGLGVHAGFQLRFNAVYINLVHGRYVQRWQAEEANYNRVMIQVCIRKNLSATLALHTHGFRAHHPSIGWVWLL